MRRYLIALALLASIAPAYADLVNNPGIQPSGPLQPGNCLQATGERTIATTSGPCGSGGDSGNIDGPDSSTIGALAVWTNGTGTQLGNSSILLSNLATLGGTNTWGGANTFSIRPTFNGAVPFDSLNLNPALYGRLASANVWSGDNTWTGLTTFSSRPLFGLATPWDTGNFDPTQYLLKTVDPLVIDNLTVNGAATFADRPTFNGNAPWDAGNFNPSQYMLQANPTSQVWTADGPATAFLGFRLNAGGVLGWNIGTQDATGALHFFHYTSAGFAGDSLSIDKTTGQISMQKVPTWNGGAIPWDSNTFHPENYLTLAAAASTYLTKVDAAATYTTPAEVDAALSTFLTKASAASTYFPLAGNVGIGPISNVTPGNSIIPAVLAIGGDVAQVGLYPQATAQLAGAGGANPRNTVIQAGDAAIIAERGNQQIAALTVGVGDFNSPSAAGIRFTVGAAGNGAISLGVRPTFAGATAWDSLNLTPATVSSFLTATTGDARYLKLAGGTVTGPTQFNAMPTINVSLPPVTDSSLDVATSAWTQAVITNRVGTGPFIPLTGIGMPYDIAIPFTGVITAPTPSPMPSGYHILYYTFTRKVVIPVSFAGSRMSALKPATAAVNLGIISTGVAGGIGNLNCAAGATTCTFVTVGGPFIFNPGDILSITTSGNTPDATLAGISGTIEGTISQ